MEKKGKKRETRVGSFAFKFSTPFVQKWKNVERIDRFSRLLNNLHENVQASTSWPWIIQPRKLRQNCFLAFSREKEKERKKGNGIKVDLPILRNHRFLSCFENLSPSFVLRDRDIIVYMTQRITFFCYFLPIEEKITEIDYIFVTLNLTNLRYL